MGKIKGAFVLLCLSMSITLGNASLAPFITKCSWDDQECLKKNTQDTIPIFAAGIPELNVLKMDPLNFEKIDASSPNLKLEITDVNVTGLKGCTAIKVVKDIEKKKIQIVAQCDINLKAKYEMDGKLFILPIVGKGDFTGIIRKFFIDMLVDYTDKEKNGKKYWSVKGWKHTFELKDKSDIKFDNLFPDSELLRKTTNEFIQNNGNEIIMEVGPPIIQAILASVVENILKFFAKVPIADLSLNF